MIFKTSRIDIMSMKGQDTSINATFKYTTVVVTELCWCKMYWVTLYANPCRGFGTGRGRVLLETPVLERALEYAYRFLMQEDATFEGMHRPRGLKGAFVLTRRGDGSMTLRTMNKCGQKGCKFRMLTEGTPRECFDFFHDLAS